LKYFLCAGLPFLFPYFDEESSEARLGLLLPYPSSLTSFLEGKVEKDADTSGDGGSFEDATSFFFEELAFAFEVEFDGWKFGSPRKAPARPRRFFCCHPDNNNILIATTSYYSGGR
jgi:hypothetical protein